MANIALNDAMILPYGANLGRMEFSERTGRRHLWLRYDMSRYAAPCRDRLSSAVRGLHPEQQVRKEYPRFRAARADHGRDVPLVKDCARFLSGDGRARITKLQVHNRWTPDASTSCRVRRWTLRRTIFTSPARADMFTGAAADTHRPHSRREDLSVRTVVVAHQVDWRRGPWKRLGDLSSQPLGCRMPCHLEPQQLSPAVTQNQERKQEIKGQRRHNAHIDGGNRLSVVPQKRLPGLRWRLRRSGHISRDRRLSHLKAKHQKLAMDPGCAPKWVFPAHPLD